MKEEKKENEEVIRTLDGDFDQKLKAILKQVKEKVGNVEPRMGTEKFENVKKIVKNSKLKDKTQKKDGKLLVDHISNVNQALPFEEKIIRMVGKTLGEVEKGFGECSIICIAFVLNTKEEKFDTFKKEFIQRMNLDQEHFTKNYHEQTKKAVLTFEIFYYIRKFGGGRTAKFFTANITPNCASEGDNAKLAKYFEEFFKKNNKKDILKTMTNENILKYLDEDYFAIVCVDSKEFYNNSKSFGHFIVVFGYYKDENDETQFILMDPNFSEIQIISAANLEKCRTDNTDKDIVFVKK